MFIRSSPRCNIQMYKYWWRSMPCCAEALKMPSGPNLSCKWDCSRYAVAALARWKETRYPTWTGVWVGPRDVLNTAERISASAGNWTLLSSSYSLACSSQPTYRHIPYPFKPFKEVISQKGLTLIVSSQGKLIGVFGINRKTIWHPASAGRDANRTRDDDDDDDDDGNDDDGNDSHVLLTAQPCIIFCK